MQAVEQYAPGMFCWVELGTTSAQSARKFYTSLFGWQTQDYPTGPGQVYTMVRVEGKDVGAFYEMPQEMRAMGIPPNWLQYVSVLSADETAARVKTLGGAVLKEPFDVMDAGRMAVIQDPTGAVFAVWQANRHIGARGAGAPGTLCWSELITSDKAKAIEFYTKLFGWTAKTNPADPHQYTEISNQGRPIGGMMQMSKDWGNAPAHWMAYFTVANCDASVAKVLELGGSTKAAAMDLPNVGRFAVVADPQDAVFALFQPAAR